MEFLLAIVFALILFTDPGSSSKHEVERDYSTERFTATDQQTSGGWYEN